MEVVYGLSGIQLMKDRLWTPPKDPLQRLRQTQNEQITYLLSILVTQFLKDVINPSLWREKGREYHTEKDLLQYLCDQIESYFDNWDNDPTLSFSAAVQARKFAGTLVESLHYQAESLVSLATTNKRGEAKRLLGTAGSLVLINGAKYANTHIQKKEPKIDMRWVQTKSQQIQANIFDPGIPVIVSQYASQSLPPHLAVRG